MGQLWVNSQTPSFHPATLWLTGKIYCIKSTRKLGNQEESQETASDKTPLNKRVWDLQMQEAETTKHFCDKIRFFLWEWLGFSQAGKGDGQTEVIALTAAIRADSEQEAYLVALSELGSNPRQTGTQIGLCCFKILFPLCYLLSSLIYLLSQPPGLGYPSVLIPATALLPITHLRSIVRAVPELQVACTPPEKPAAGPCSWSMLQHTPAVTQILVTSWGEQSLHRPAINSAGPALKEKGREIQLTAKKYFMNTYGCI